MSRPQQQLLTGLTAVVVCLLIGFIIWVRNSPPAIEPIAEAPAPEPIPAQPAPVAPAPPTPIAVAPAPDPGPVTPAQPAQPARRRGQPNNPVPPAAGQQPVVSEPVARQALAQVGADDQANQVWFAAISDPAMPARSRQNLIEDLNEAGFADPRNLTADDLPLIQSRIAILEKLGPDQTDPVNLAAFNEAYKDLLNMRRRLTGQ